MGDPVLMSIADELANGVLWAFGFGVLAGGLMLGPVVVNLLDRWADYRVERKWSQS